MPTPKNPPKHDKNDRNLISTESDAYLSGLYQEFSGQVKRYHDLTAELLSLEARIELAEKTLSLTRDHLAMTIARTDSATPRGWDETLKSARFVGVRLADACMLLLQENKKMTLQELLIGLNKSMYRFHTNSPLREIHAALLRQPWVKKVGQTWTWTGNAEQQLPLRLRVLERPKVAGGLKDGSGK
jgi:hypothetical protein